ncbi:MAG TPA: hypothetical protein VKQ71_17705 [Acidimicrobiales bacterium]|nr:hypothetical protein [Acidimicrobiales bacterium]
MPLTVSVQAGCALRGAASGVAEEAEEAEEAEVRPLARYRRPPKALKKSRGDADGLTVSIAPPFDVAPAVTPQRHWLQAGRVVARGSNASRPVRDLKGRPIA